MTRDELRETIDEFLTCDKELASPESPPAWSPTRNDVGYETKLPVGQCGLQLGACLVIKSLPLDAFVILVTCFDICVSRLDFESHGTHVNTLNRGSSQLAPIVSARHFHRWTFNRHLVTDECRLPEMKVAEELPESIRTFDAALRWFCSETNISLPHGHRIELQRYLT